MSPVLENHFVPKVLVFILLVVILGGSLLEGVVLLEGSSSICMCYITTQHRMIKFVSFLWLGTFWEICSKNEKLCVYLFNRLSQLNKEYYLKNRRSVYYLILKASSAFTYFVLSYEITFLFSIWLQSSNGLLELLHLMHSFIKNVMYNSSVTTNVKYLFHLHREHLLTASNDWRPLVFIV